MTLGDAVRVRIKRADLQKRQLDFELLLPRKTGSAPKKKGMRTSGSPAVKRSTRRKN